MGTLLDLRIELSHIYIYTKIYILYYILYTDDRYTTAQSIYTIYIDRETTIVIYIHIHTTHHGKSIVAM